MCLLTGFRFNSFAPVLIASRLSFRIFYIFVFVLLCNIFRSHISIQNLFSTKYTKYYRNNKKSRVTAPKFEIISEVLIFVS